MTLKLRTQLLLVFALAELFAIGVGLSYWVQSRAEARLAEAFHQDLAVLAKLPQLGDGLRQLDDMTDRYLLEGDPRWLDKRREALAEVRRVGRELAELIAEPAEHARVHELDSLLAAYLAQQDQWIAQKQLRRMPHADAVRVAAGAGPFEQISDRVARIKDVSVEELQRRRDAVRRASQWSLATVLATGFAAGLVLVLFLSRNVIGPILDLARVARGWELGRPWPLGSAQGSPEVESLIACMKDMTERLNRQFTRERELGRLKTQLVSMVSHEFNNAMTVINGVTALQEDSEDDPSEKQLERRKRYYGMIRDNVRALTLASTNILNMGRLESGQFAVSRRKIEVRAVLRESAARLEVLSQRKDLAVSLELPPEPIPVLADPEALALVVTNLLSNAIKYTPEKGRIVLGLRPEGDGAVRVYVTDTGLGLSGEERGRILQGYYRTEAGKRAAKGFGVGLSLANSIIQAHGSALEIESAPGRGSTFSFALPVWRDDSAPKAAPDPVPAV